eukprot:scaffold10600_cov107-Isochrysis_galbana.AAC.4
MSKFSVSRLRLPIVHRVLDHCVLQTDHVSLHQQSDILHTLGRTTSACAARTAHRRPDILDRRRAAVDVRTA